MQIQNRILLNVPEILFESWHLTARRSWPPVQFSTHIFADRDYITRQALWTSEVLPNHTGSAEQAGWLKVEQLLLDRPLRGLLAAWWYVKPLEAS